jgi:hypothetical protein
MADRSLRAGQYAAGQAGNTVAGLADALSPLLFNMIFKPQTGAGNGTSGKAPAPITGGTSKY